MSVLGFTWKNFLSPENAADKKRALFRARKLHVEYVYDMAALEGNPFTFPEVKTLLEGITVGGRKVADEDQIRHTSNAWTTLFELIQQDKFVLNKDVLCQLHRKVAEGEAMTVGEFRTGSVSISGTSFRPPNHTDLEEIFNRGLPELKKINNVYERSCAFYLFAALNQFFWDGNKRTARLMMAGELLSCGFDLINIPASKQLEFNKGMIEFYDTQDGSNMMRFLTSCIQT